MNIMNNGTIGTNVEANQKNFFPMGLGGLLGGQDSFVKSFNSNEYELFIDDYVDSPACYREHYRIFVNATPNDVIFLHINSNGGRVDAGLQLINFMKQCQAKIIGVLHCNAASMGSGLALSCDELILNEHSTMMIHTASYGAYGKETDVKAHVDFFNKSNERFIRNLYTHFLSEEEILRVLDGKEIWLHSEEIAERWATLKQAREDAQDEARTANLEALTKKAEEIKQAAAQAAASAAKPKAPAKPRPSRAKKTTIPAAK